MAGSSSVTNDPDGISQGVITNDIQRATLKVDPSLAGMKSPRRSSTFGEVPPVPHASTTLESPTSAIITDLDELCGLLDHARILASSAKGSSAGATIKIRTAMNGGVKSVTVSW